MDVNGRKCSAKAVMAPANIAGANGNETARSRRDDLEQDMTRTQFARATGAAHLLRHVLRNICDAARSDRDKKWLGRSRLRANI